MPLDWVDAIFNKNLGLSEGYGMPGEPCGMQVTEDSGRYSIALITHGREISGVWIMHETDFKIKM